MSDPLNPEQLRSLTPLNVLSEQQWRELRSQLVPQHLLAGQLLFREGDQARLTYYLLSGELLLVSASGQQEHLLAGSEASCHPLSPSLPRLHEVRALTDVSLLVLDSATLARLLTWRSAYHDLLLELEQGGEDVEWVARLLENPLFAKVPPSNVRAMLGRLQRVELPAGSAVLREGDVGDCCFFLKSGRAEVIRGAGSAHQVLAELEVGAIVDADFLQWLAAHCDALLADDDASLAEAIARSCTHKAAITERDPFEHGDRALLNFGHTFAHAIEAEQGYAHGFNHGEAVAVGMVLAARLSSVLGMATSASADALRDLLQRFDLPVDMPTGLVPDALLARMRLDKKAQASGLRFILWQGPGSAQVVADVPEAAVLSMMS